MSNACRINQISKEEYNELLLKSANNQFLQSWDWGEFQEKTGNETFHLAMENSKKELISVLTFFRKKLFLGYGYFYAPRVISDFRFQISDIFFEIKKIAEKEKCVFLRFDPLTYENRKSCLPAGAAKIDIRKSLDVQPKKTLILDITGLEEDILKQMHSKTRYNIRLAERNGVSVKIVNNKDNDLFEQFWLLMLETSKRDGFRLHNKEHYRKMLAVEFIRLVGAFYQDKLIAANILSFFGDTATYIHGASSSSNRNLMATYALQWHSIKFAKERKCSYYDFYGIDEEKWPGVTRFKKGFGGKEIEYPGTFDLIFNTSKYGIYKLLRIIRRKI